MFVNAASSTAQRLRMGGANLTVKLAVGTTTTGSSIDVRGAAIRLMVCNPAGTSGTLTFVPSTGVTAILWPGGTVPSKTTTANKCDLYGFTFSGATSTASAVTAIGSQSPNY